MGSQQNNSSIHLYFFYVATQNFLYRQLSRFWDSDKKKQALMSNAKNRKEYKRRNIEVKVKIGTIKSKLVKETESRPLRIESKTAEERTWCK